MGVYYEVYTVNFMKTDKLKEIQCQMRSGVLPYSKMNEYQIFLVGDYSFYSGIVESIKTRKPGVWNKMRENHKSDKATDREWEATGDGINEKVLKYRMRRLEKMIGLIKDLRRSAEVDLMNGT